MECDLKHGTYNPYKRRLIIIATEKTFLNHELYSEDNLSHWLEPDYNCFVYNCF